MTTATALQALLAPLVTPGPLIMADQNGPRPGKPFAALSLRSTRPFGPIVEQVDENGFVRVTQYLHVNTELQCFGLGGYARSQMVGLRLMMPSNVQRADSLGLAISRVNQALRVPELLNENQYEERGILEFVAYASISADDEVGLIEQVEIECFGHTHTVKAEKYLLNESNDILLRENEYFFVME